MISKRYKALPRETKKLKHNTIENLLRTVKKNCTTKFDESIDVNFQLNLKQKKSEVNIRTVLNLPVGKNKKIKVGVSEATEWPVRKKWIGVWPFNCQSTERCNRRKRMRRRPSVRPMIPRQICVTE